MSRRHTFWNALVAALLVVQVAGAGGAWFARTSGERHLLTVTAHADSVRAQLAAMPTAPLVESAPAPSRWQLPAANDVAVTMQALQLLADTAGVTLEGLKALPATAAGRQQFALTVAGTPTRVVAFVVALEEQDRLLVIENGRVGAGGAEQILADLTVVAWHHGGDR